MFHKLGLELDMPSASYACVFVDIAKMGHDIDIKM